MSASIIGYPIHSDAAYLSGGAWANAALSHMQTEELSDVARSTNALAASTQWDTDHGSPVVARAIALVAHNISKAGKVKFRASERVDFGLLASVAPDISKAPWNDSGTPVVTAVVGPDGELSGYSINDNDAGVAELRSVVLATSGGDGVKSFGIWVKKGTSTASVIQIRDSTAGANRLLATITWVGTTPGTPAMTTGACLSQQVSDDGLWYYLLFTTTAVTAANTNQLWLYGATATVGTTGTTFYAFPGYCTRNLVTSSDISGGSWSDDGTPAVSVTAGPYGAQDGYTIYDSGGGEARSIGILPGGANGVRAMNLWVKKGSAATSVYQLHDVTGAAYKLTVTITWVGTTPGTPIASSGGTYVSQTAGDNGWYLIRCLTASLTAANTHALYLRVTNGGAAGSVAYALPRIEDATACYEDRYCSGWKYAYPQIYAGPSNLLEASQDLRTAWSVNAGSPIARFGYADPLGGQRAFQIEDDDAGVQESWYAVPRFLTDGTKVFALYVKQGSAAGCAFGLFDATALATKQILTVTWGASGAPTVASTGSGTVSTPVDMGNGWYRIASTVNSIVSVHTHIFLIYPADAALAANVGTTYVFQPWAEDAAILATAILQTGEPGYTDGRLTQADIDAGWKNDVIHPLPSNVLAQYWRTEIDDTANADGYVEVGRLAIVFGYEASINIVEGASFGHATDSSATRTDGGSRYVNERPRWREAAFAFEMLPEDEVYVRHHDFMRRVGIHGQWLWIEEPGATLHAARKNYLAQLSILNKLQKPHAFFHTQVYAATEVI